VLACLNYSLLPVTKQPTARASKVVEALKQLSVPVQGPIWNSLIAGCIQKVHMMHEFNTRRNFLSELKPIIKLKQFQNLANIGCTTLARHHLVNLVKLFGRDALTIKSIVNTLYAVSV
jgi:hypothetical protein